MGIGFWPPPETSAGLPSPNYVDPETHGTCTVVVAIIGAVLCTIMVVLRLVARVHTRKGLGWDDFWIVLGQIVSLAGYVDVILSIKIWGWKYHVRDIPPELKESTAIFVITSIFLFIISTSCIRLSLLTLYLRLLRDSNTRLWRHIIYGFCIFTIAFTVAFAIASVIRCTPVSAFWKVDPPEGFKCTNSRVLSIICGSFIVVADMATVLLPLPVVFRFNLPLRQRVSVAILLSLGLVVVFVSITRCYYVVASTHSSDPVWDSQPLWICTCVEILIGTSCACLPAIKPLYDKFCSSIADRARGSRLLSRPGTLVGLTVSTQASSSVHPDTPNSYVGDRKSVSAGMFELSACTTTCRNITTIEEGDEDDSSAAGRLEPKPSSGAASATGTRDSMDLESQRAGSAGRDGITVVRSVQMVVSRV